MSRFTIQVLFVVVGFGWLAFVGFHLFAYTFGDCVDDGCERYRDAMRGLIFWRGLFVALLIVLAYRFFRKEPDV